MNKYTFLANSNTRNPFLTVFLRETEFIPLAEWYEMNATVNMTIDECIALNNNHKLQ